MFRWLAGLGLLAVAFPTPAAAQQRQVPPPATHYASIEPADPTARARQLLSDARWRLDHDLHTLERYLQRGGAEYAAQWKAFLHWDVLAAELARPEPDPARLEEVRRRFYGATQGLELPQFQAVRRSLRQYEVLTTSGESIDATRPEKLAELSRAFEDYRATTSRESGWQVGQLLGWLETTQTHDPVVAQARQSLSLPNGYFHVSSRLINRFLERSLEESEAMRSFIGGSWTSGHVTTKAKLSLEAMPSNNYGALDVVLRGTSVVPSSVAQRQRLTVYGSSRTELDGRVRIIVTEEQVRTEQPVVRARTRTQVHDIAANRRFIERLAWRRIPERLPEVEAEASRQAERKLSEKMAERVTPMLAHANRLYKKSIRGPLERSGAWPKLMAQSDARGLQLVFRAADTFQVAAHEHPGEWRGDGDLVLCAHESLPENMLETLMGGKEFKDAQFLRMMELFTGDAPRQLWVHERAERWSVVLSNKRPMRVEFRDGLVTLGFSIEQVKRGDKTYDMPALVTGKFEVRSTLDGPALFRQGDLTIEFPQQETLTAEAENLRKFLDRKFGAVLAEEFYFDGLAPPAGGFGDKLRELKVTYIKFENGWGNVRYSLRPSTPQVQPQLADR